MDEWPRNLIIGFLISILLVLIIGTQRQVEQMERLLDQHQRATHQYQKQMEQLDKQREQLDKTWPDDVERFLDRVLPEDKNAKPTG